MSSIKIILFKGKTYSDGTHPIMLQYSNDGKIKRKVLHKCLIGDWEPKTGRVKGRVKNSAYINNHISASFSKAEQEHFKILRGEASKISQFETALITTVRQALQLEMQRLKKLCKPTAFRQLQAYLDQIEELGDTALSDLNINWFNNIIDKFKKLKNSPSTLEKKLKNIRRLIAKYSDFELSKDIKSLRITSPKAVKQKLTLSEFELIKDAKLKPGTNMEIARDIFVLQVYLRGVRIGDILQATNDQFSDGRFTYESEKTGKEMGIKLVPQAVAIINQYSGKYPRLFPFFNWTYNPKLSKFDNESIRLKHKESCTSTVNNNLKKLAEKVGITKPLSSHIARHTFARMAIDKINNPMVTMELLGHSSLAVHQSYLNDIRKDDVLDAAADDIFG